MSTVPSEPIDMTHELDTLCRCGIRAAWHLSLLWGALVSLLSWTGGAVAATAVIRGLVTFFAFGLVGWGVNAIMVQAGHQGDDASSGRDGGARTPSGQDAGATEREHAADASAVGAGDGGKDRGAGAGEDTGLSAESGSGVPDSLAEAAS